MIRGGHSGRCSRNRIFALRLLAGALGGLAFLAGPVEPVAAEPGPPLFVDAGASGGDKREKVIPAFALVLLAVLGLVVVFLIVSLVIVRSARRHRAALGDGRRSPTPVSDVWGTHRVPQDIADALDDGETDESL